MLPLYYLCCALPVCSFAVVFVSECTPLWRNCCLLCVWQDCLYSMYLREKFFELWWPFLVPFLYLCTFFCTFVYINIFCIPFYFIPCTFCTIVYFFILFYLPFSGSFFIPLISTWYKEYFRSLCLDRQSEKLLSIF